MIEHIKSMRNIWELKDSTAVIGVETNLGFEAQRIIHAAQTHPLRKYIALWEGPQNTPGLLTTNSSKEIMCRALQDVLTNNRLVFSSQFMCTTMPPKAAMQALVTEMKTFMIVVAAPNTPFGKPRRTYTGKSGGGQNDDMVSVLIKSFGFDSSSLDVSFRDRARIDTHR